MKLSASVHLLKHGNRLNASLREVAPRSYEALVVGVVHRPNRKNIWRTAEPPNTRTAEEVEPFQRAPVASPGPDPETPLVDPASSPVEADCVGESASSSSVNGNSAQPLTRFTRQIRPLERLKAFIIS